MPKADNRETLWCDTCVVMSVCRSDDATCARSGEMPVALFDRLCASPPRTRQMAFWSMEVGLLRGDGLFCRIPATPCYVCLIFVFFFLGSRFHLSFRLASCKRWTLVGEEGKRLAVAMFHVLSTHPCLVWVSEVYVCP